MTSALAEDSPGTARAPTTWEFHTVLPRFVSLDELVGGPEIRPYELFTHAAMLGHRVHVWETDNPGFGRRSIQERLVAESLVPGRSVRSQPGLLRHLMRRLSERRHVTGEEAGHRFCFYQPFPSGAVLKRGFLPVLVNPSILFIPIARRWGWMSWAALHDLPPEHGSSMLRRNPHFANRKEVWFANLVGRVQQRLLFGSCTFVSAVSEEMRSLVIHRYGLDEGQVRVFPSAVNPRLVKGLRPWHPPQHKEPWTIGYVGSPLDVSLRLLFSSLAHLPRGTVRLLLGGIGMDAAVRRIGAGDLEVRVIDGIRYARFEEVARQTDLWVLPYEDPYYREVTWELKVPLLVASGRPVIRTGGSVVRSSGLAPFLVETGPTPQEIAATVLHVIRNPDGAAERAVLGRDHVLRHLTWRTVVTRLLSLFDERASSIPGPGTLPAGRGVR